MSGCVLSPRRGAVSDVLQTATNAAVSNRAIPLIQGLSRLAPARCRRMRTQVGTTDLARTRSLTAELGHMEPQAQ